ncbi:putative U3 small nucleolar RNA-associated protein 7 [Balamuthia mandrillaris]
MEAKQENNTEERVFSPILDEGAVAAHRRGTKRKRKNNKNKDGVSTKAQKYERGSAPNLKHIKDKKLKSRLQRKEKLYKEAAMKAARAEILLPSEAGSLEATGIDKTYKYTQRQIAEAIDVQSAAKIFDLKLESHAPYKLAYTRNGRYLAIAGQKGHVGMIDWLKNKMHAELFLQETVRDITFLQDHMLYAVAQKKHVYIYDNTGMETHRLKSHVNVTRLDYLPYHWLLVSVGDTGYLKYQDTSTGELVVELRTRLGRCEAMRQNPHNAIMCLGHHNGTVTMWTPNMTTPVVKMLCHRGPVTALAIHNNGHYMATSGNDGKMKLWDLRTYKPLGSYYTTSPAAALDISQKGLLGAGSGPHVTVWKDVWATKQERPYMKHLILGASIVDMHFVPYEDVLGIGHSKGMSSIVVPGAGEPNFDTFEVDPYQTAKQRKEHYVHALLDKLQPEMITLEPDSIATVDRAPQEVLEEEKKLAFEANNLGKEYKKKNKMKGKNAIGRRLKSRQKNVIDEKRMKLKDELAKQKLKEQQEKKKKEKEGAAKSAYQEEEYSGDSLNPPSALDRFTRKK